MPGVPWELYWISRWQYQKWVLNAPSNKRADNLIDKVRALIA